MKFLLFKTLNKLFFKNGFGILSIILNLLYIIMFGFSYKGFLTQSINLPFLMIISNSILLMPMLILRIKKMTFIKKFFLIKKSKIKNFLPLFYFFVVNIFLYFFAIAVIFLINIKEQKIIDSFFSSIDIFEFLFSLILVNLFCLFFGQVLFLYINNFLALVLLSNFIYLFGSFLSGALIPIEMINKNEIMKTLSLMNPFTYLNNLLSNALTSKGNEFINLEKGGIFDFDKDFIGFSAQGNRMKTKIIFDKDQKLYNFLFPFLSIILMFFITLFKKIELEFNSKSMFFNNFKRIKKIDHNSNTLIEVKNLNKTFKKQKIFKNANLSIYKKDVLGIIGENGTGKTTFFKILSGLGNADSGTINYNFDYKYSQAEKMNFLFQNSKYPELLKVKDVLDCCIDKNIDLNYFNSIKKIFNIKPILNKRTYVLSGGEKQRLSLLISIIDKPDILFLDEFTSNLDIKTKFETLKKLKKYFNQTRTACILITHDINVLKNFCNKIVLLKNKKFQNVEKKDINEEKIISLFN